MHILGKTKMKGAGQSKSWTDSFNLTNRQVIELNSMHDSELLNQLWKFLDATASLDYRMSVSE